MIGAMPPTIPVVLSDSTQGKPFQRDCTIPQDVFNLFEAEHLLVFSDDAVEKSGEPIDLSRVDARYYEWVHVYCVLHSYDKKRTEDKHLVHSWRQREEFDNALTGMMRKTLMDSKMKIVELKYSDPPKLDELLGYLKSRYTQVEETPLLKDSMVFKVLNVVDYLKVNGLRDLLLKLVADELSKWINMGDEGIVEIRKNFQYKHELLPEGKYQPRTEKVKRTKKVEKTVKHGDLEEIVMEDEEYEVDEVVDTGDDIVKGQQSLHDKYMATHSQEEYEAEQEKMYQSFLEKGDFPEGMLEQIVAENKYITSVKVN